MGWSSIWWWVKLGRPWARWRQRIVSSQIAWRSCSCNGATRKLPQAHGQLTLSRLVPRSPRSSLQKHGLLIVCVELVLRVRSTAAGKVTGRGRAPRVASKAMGRMAGKVVVASDEVGHELGRDLVPSPALRLGRAHVQRANPKWHVHIKAVCLASLLYRDVADRLPRSYAKTVNDKRISGLK